MKVRTYLIAVGMLAVYCMLLFGADASAQQKGWAQDTITTTTPEAGSGSHTSELGSQPAKTFDALERQTPRVPNSDGEYFYKGSRMSEKALRAEWEQEVGRRSILTLIVHVVNGELDYWRRPEDRDLTYAVDRRTFSEPEYEEIVRRVKEAATDWENACPECGLAFKHNAEIDSSPSHEQVKFIVRKNPTEQIAIASSFFPSADATERYITVGREFFTQTTFDKTGVLRHQMGHILGYRHSHISGIEGCPSEGDENFFAGQYDPESVMHYLCGGGGTTKLALTQKDKESHRLLYGYGSLEVELSGERIVRNAVDLLAALGKRGLAEPRLALLEFKPLLLTSRQECTTYLKEIGLLSAAQTTSSDSDWATCFGFSERFRKSHTEAILVPLVQFVATERRRIGEFAVGDEKVKDFIARVRATVIQVPPSEIDSLLGPDNPSRASLQWTVYILKLYGSSLAIEESWTRVESVAKGNQNIFQRIVPSISTQLNNRRTIPAYNQVFDASLLRDPFVDKERICRRDNNEVSYVGRMLGVEAEELELRTLADNTSVVEAACHRPKALDSFCDRCRSHSVRNTLYCSLCDAKEAPARIVVIDRKLDREALVNPTRCEWADWNANKNDFHGTHMASLAAGRGKFFGVAPSSDLEHLERTEFTPDQQIADRIQELSFMPAGSQPIVYLFASQFCYDPGAVQGFTGVEEDSKQLCELLHHKRGGLDTWEEAVLRNRLSEVVHSYAGNHPWITAIGQPTISGQNPTEFDNMSLAAPMLLAGDKHVILVTTCDPCDQTPGVWSGAHKGKQSLKPHVAAPGGVDKPCTIDGKQGFGIPGAAGSPGRYSCSAGTSQSTAIVAGAVAKVTACYPTAYSTRPSWVKEAVQLTADPIMKDPDREFVTSGVLNLGVLLKYPFAHHLKSTQTNSWEEVLSFENENPDLAWCSGSFTFEGTRVEANQIRRIKKIGQKWVVLRSQRAGQIDRTPFLLNDGTPILKYKNRVFDLGDIEDFVTFVRLQSTVDCH